LSNALSGVIPKEKQGEGDVWSLRAERLSVKDFVELTKDISLKLA
jgi:16S rRNA (adenine1518-N6/adenine1519-N6)-dimethyltransferase